MAPTRPAERRWARAAALFLVALTLSPRPFVFIALPFAMLAMVGHGRRGAVLVAATIMAALVLTGPAGSGAWYLERGWALFIGGWFVLLSFRWPDRTFFTRALGAVAGAFAAGALFFVVRPGGWGVADWSLTSRVVAGASTSLEIIRLMQGGGPLSPALVAAAQRAAEIQGLLYPATLGLASLAALGVAWWLYVRLVHGSDLGLGPFRDFRFNDQLVWVLVAGVLALVLRAEGGLERAGANTVVFMAVLYLLRGAAVVADLGGGISFFGGAVVALALLFMWPILLPVVLLIGLGDTWLDLRNRLRAQPG